MVNTDAITWAGVVLALGVFYMALVAITAGLMRICLLFWTEGGDAFDSPRAAWWIGWAAAIWPVTLVAVAAVFAAATAAVPFWLPFAMRGAAKRDRLAALRRQRQGRRKYGRWYSLDDAKKSIEYERRRKRGET